MKIGLSIIILLVSSLCFSQEQNIDWLTFEELEHELQKQPKKVLIHFYADWCDFCKKMEEDVYTKPNIKAKLASEFYAIKFNVEATDTITFGGKVFKNMNIGKTRNPNHQIAELLAQNDSNQIVLPTVLFFNKDFVLEQRLFRYISPKELMELLDN